MSKSLEILKTAILMERRGQAFYKKVAEETKSNEVREIFELMAKEEVMHEEFLAEQYKSMEKNEKFSEKDFPAVAANNIAKTILNDEIINALSAASFEAAAISAAIDMESNAIRVYGNRAKEATDPNEKKLFQWLSDWEQGHLKILMELDNELKEKIWNDNQFWPF